MNSKLKDGVVALTLIHVSELERLRKIESQWRQDHQSKASQQLAGYGDLDDKALELNTVRNFSNKPDNQFSIPKIASAESLDLHQPSRFLNTGVNSHWEISQSKQQDHKVPWYYIGMRDEE